MNQFLFIFQHLDIRPVQPSPNQWQHWFARMVARNCSLWIDDNQPIIRKQLLIIGGSLAGCRNAGEVEITLVTADNYLTIRPLLYELSRDDLQVALAPYLQTLRIRQGTCSAPLVWPQSHYSYPPIPQF